MKSVLISTSEKNEHWESAAVHSRYPTGNHILCKVNRCGLRESRLKTLKQPFLNFLLLFYKT